MANSGKPYNEGYHTKVSNFLTDAYIRAKKKLRDTIPSQAEFDTEVEDIAHPGPKMSAVHARGEMYRDPRSGKLRNTADSPSDVFGDLFNVADAGAIVGGAGRFGEMGKRAKALLKEWHGLGLKDLTLDHAMEYLKTPLKDILTGATDHKLAGRIAEAGGNPLKHHSMEEIEKTLRETGYADFSPEVRKGFDEAGIHPGEAGEFPRLKDEPGTPEDLPVPKTPEEWDAFHASIPDARGDLTPEMLDQLHNNPAVPGQDYVPASGLDAPMVERLDGPMPTPGEPPPGWENMPGVPGGQRRIVDPSDPLAIDRRQYDIPRSQTRAGRGRRVEDRELATVKDLVEQARVSNIPPDEVVKQMERMGIDPANYDDMLSFEKPEMAPGLRRPPPEFGVTPANPIGGIRQQPPASDDFPGAVNKLLQATNSWDETVKSVVEHTKAQKLTKEEVTGKLMEHFGHENPQLSTLVNKYWKD